MAWSINMHPPPPQKKKKKRTWSMQYPTILSSRLANNPYALLFRGHYAKGLFTFRNCLIHLNERYFYFDQYYFSLGGDICSLPKSPGLCMGYFPRWFYNTKKGKCESFIYGGCNANANNFDTKEECEETCLGENKIKLNFLISIY